MKLLVYRKRLKLAVIKTGTRDKHPGFYIIQSEPPTKKDKASIAKIIQHSSIQRNANKKNKTYCVCIPRYF